MTYRRICEADSKRYLKWNSNSYRRQDRRRSHVRARETHTAIHSAAMDVPTGYRPCRTIFFSPSFSRSLRLRVRLNCAVPMDLEKYPPLTRPAMMAALPLICPTCQMVLWNARHHADSHRLSVHGVVFDILLSGHESLGPGLNSSCLAVEPSPQLSTFSAAINASCGMSTLPNCRIFFLPSFCFSRSLRFRVMSPP